MIKHLAENESFGSISTEDGLAVYSGEGEDHPTHHLMSPNLSPTSLLLSSDTDTTRETATELAADTSDACNTLVQVN